MSGFIKKAVSMIPGISGKDDAGNDNVAASDKRRSTSWSVDHWVSNGSARLTDLQAMTGINLDVGSEIKTINDLLLKELKRIPNPGDEIVVNGLSFLVLNIKKFRAGDIQIRFVTT